MMTLANVVAIIFWFTGVLSVMYGFVEMCVHHKSKSDFFTQDFMFALFGIIVVALIMFYY